MECQSLNHTSGPFAGLLLSDAGANVIRIDRAVSGQAHPTEDMLTRHKASIGVNLKSPQGIDFVKQLAKKLSVYRTKAIRCDMMTCATVSSSA